MLACLIPTHEVDPSTVLILQWKSLKLREGKSDLPKVTQPGLEPRQPGPES